MMSARRAHGLKLTNGFVVVERESLRSLNIGSLCFNEIVKWARRVAPDDVVLPIQLLESHVNTYVKEDLETRHRFYCQFGLSFEFKSDASHPLASGESKPVAGRDLISRPLTKYANIDEIDIVTTVQRFAVDQEELRIDVKRFKKALSDLLQARQRRRYSVVQFALPMRGPLVFLAFAPGVFWKSRVGSAAVLAGSRARQRRAVTEAHRARSHALRAQPLDDPPAVPHGASGLENGE